MVYGAAPDPLMAAFWDGARAGRLLLQECRACGDRRFPPVAVCPKCLSPDQGWGEASGRGRVESAVTFHQRYWDDRPTPYSVLLVRLDEGPLMMSNPASGAREAAIGDAVRVRFEAQPDGSVLPQFAPEPGA